MIVRVLQAVDGSYPNAITKSSNTSLCVLIALISKHKNTQQYISKIFSLWNLFFKSKYLTRQVKYIKLNNKMGYKLFKQSYLIYHMAYLNFFIHAV